ncbi:MAG: lactoylglutathione lyase [Polaromonas sp.]
MTLPLSGGRLLHTMLRVADLDRAIAFYVDLLGMRLLRRRDYPEGRFTLAFLGYGDERDVAVLELTHNWDTVAYAHGTAYGHIALSLPDLEGACAALRRVGATITRQPGPMRHDAGEIIAFVEDPDGYRIELIQHAAN